MNKDSTLDIATDFVAEFEGFSSTPYNDVVGVKTFGYGSLLKYYPDQVFPISEEDAKGLLKLGLVACYNCVNSAVTVSLTDNQAAALCSFVYNLGCGAFKGSTLLKLINGGSVDKTVALQFPRWDKADGEVSAGLLRRRNAEAELYLKG